jgi:signal transduction histidine kinase
LRASELRDERATDIDFRIDVAARDRSIRLGADDLGRIVDNLVDNALAAASGDVEIVLELRQRDDTAVLTVSDDAGGFDPAIAERAFERFVRGPAGASSGGGLGLAIVSRLASRAGGSAQIENHPGTGASIVVTLPVSDGVSAGESAADSSANTHHR